MQKKKKLRQGVAPCSTIQHQKNITFNTKWKINLSPIFQFSYFHFIFFSLLNPHLIFLPCLLFDLDLTAFRVFDTMQTLPILPFPASQKATQPEGIKYAFRSLAPEANHICAHEGHASQCCQLPSVLINKEPLLQNSVGFWENPAEEQPYNRIIQHLSLKLHLSPEWSFHRNLDATHAAPPRFQECFKALD